MVRPVIPTEVLAGGLLLLAAVAALLVSNSSLSPLYDALLATPVGVRAGGAGLEKPLLLWINDGLMAVFFFLVGLEIKREARLGHLADRKILALPLAAAVGGMVVPAAIYIALNAGNSAALNGWAIPAATDIAFALGILATLGKRIPPALRLFLMALAVIDDLGAIVIIAIFYTADLSGIALAGAGLLLAALAALNFSGVRKLTPYILLGVVLWVFVLKSGVHATLAGVALAFAIPLADKNGDTAHGPLLAAEHAVYPWVTWGVLPVFAFANAGVSFAGLGFSALTETVTLGIALGLLVGKPVGVILAARLAVRVGVAELPGGLNWSLIAGAGVLAGIGFTMSLFIGGLAFSGPEAAAQVRLGVLAGSVLAAVIGYLYLRRAARA
jgi:Na+:H+ antiporter, NhaA family